MRHAFVIPAYGDSPFLPDCLDSIASQSGAGSAVAIATSTPSPYLERVAERHQVPLLVNPMRSSIGGDWNFALCATDAPLVTLAHQDDLYQPDYLETVRDAVLREPDTVIAFSDYRETTALGLRPPNINLRLKQFLCRQAFGEAETLRATAAKRRLLRWGNPICCPSVVLNRSAIPTFRFDESLRSNLDWEGWLRLAEQPGAFAYVRQPLVTRRIHSRSETSALIADRRRLLEDRAMFERFWPAPVAAVITLVYRASYLANRS